MHLLLELVKIIKVPFFAISSENTGIQLTDMVGHVLGRRFTGDRRIVREFFEKIKEMEFASKNKVPDKDGKGYILKGIKVAKEKKEKEAGVPEDQE